MKKYTLALVLLSALLATSCSDNDDDDMPVTPGAPSLIGRGGFSVGLHPTALSPELVGNHFCPTVPPFLLPFDLTVGADEDFDITLTQIRLQFVDTFGARMPQVTLPAPVLTTQFGSALVRARNRRSFPFLFRFGCETVRTGHLIVIVDSRDSRGLFRSHELTAVVR